ncbi:MAG: hypothetical protein HZB39_10300 [Planctomycetes bacterium]|nr:hypothetical protein [Planctomycetota bacterium]
MQRDATVDLPSLRLAIRTLPDGLVDADLVLAEAGALLAWAAVSGAATRPWLLVEDDKLAVGAEIAPDRVLPPGILEYRMPAGRYAMRLVEPIAVDELRRAAKEFGAAGRASCGRIDDAGCVALYVPARDA